MATASDDKNSEVQPTPGKCAFFVKRKSRYCKLIPAASKRFCGEHLARAFYEDSRHEAGVDDAAQDGKPERERIPCPLDPKHTVYADQLKKHLKKCNAREKAKPPYHLKGINRIGTEDNSQQRPLSSLSREDLLQLISKVRKVYQAHPLDIPTSVLSHTALQEDLASPKNGASSRKHLYQVASLMGQMQDFDLLGPDTCYVEFGAGRGQMSHWVQNALKDQSNVSFLLVDRAHVRHKFDTVHKFEKDGPQYERIRIDIEHLCLGRVPLINNVASLVTYSKHLCGAATDLTLHCLLETLHQDQDNVKDSATTQPSHSQVKGIVIALCCHHRCDWSSYVGRDWWLARGLTPSDFISVCHMSSWATCGSMPGQRLKRSKVTSAEDTEESSGYNVGVEGAENRTLVEINQMSDRRTAGDTLTKGDILRSSLTASCKIETGQNVEESSCKEVVDKLCSKLEGDSDKKHEMGITDGNNSTDMETTERKSKVTKFESDDDVHSQGRDISAQRLVGLDNTEREDIGRRCKRLIDRGRMAYLEGLGFKPKLIYYIDKEFSLENIALVAMPTTELEKNEQNS